MKTLENFLNDNFTPEERTAIRLQAKEKVAAIRLQQVRKAKHKTQKELAKAMGLSQSALSELERRPNITISAMQRYVEALGGKLIIKAVFQEGSEKLLVGDSA